ncbi:unnamed protein product [Ectocarpus sp. CCAP 1310/34]|nr:unnamed protein product [Ectocarpus sp. CCAP 1310/34]
MQGGQADESLGKSHRRRRTLVSATEYWLCICDFTVERVMVTPVAISET